MSSSALFCNLDFFEADLESADRSDSGIRLSLSGVLLVEDEMVVQSGTVELFFVDVENLEEVMDHVLHGVGELACLKDSSENPIFYLEFIRRVDRGRVTVELRARDVEVRWGNAE